MEYINLINSHVALNGLRFIQYDGRDIDVDRLCGSGDIGETFDISILSDMIEDGISLIALDGEEVIGFFAGEIDVSKNLLISEYTCATGGRKTGELLRYYGLLLAHEQNDTITTLSGSASGGIPAIQKDDNIETVLKKKTALKNYHVKRGATMDGDMFHYTIETVIENLLRITRPAQGRSKLTRIKKKPKKRKGKKTPKKQKKKPKGKKTPKVKKTPKKQKGPRSNHTKSSKHSFKEKSKNKRKIW